MSCVNTSHSDFKKLSSKYNADSSILELAIKNWMDKTKSEDYDASDPRFIGYLNNYFKLSSSNVYTSLKDFKAAHHLWEVMNRDEVSKDTAIVNYETLSKVFGRENTTMYKSNSEDGYIVRVAEPVYSTSKDSSVDTLTNILNSNNIIHKYNGNYYITLGRDQDSQGVPLSDVEYNREVAKLHSFIRLMNLPVGVVNLERQGKSIKVSINNDILANSDIINKDNTYSIQATNKALDFLQQRFPNIQIASTDGTLGITSSAAKSILGSDTIPNSFIKDNKVYLVQGKFTSETAIEEMLHPFINTLVEDNHELFTGLLNEAKKSFPNLKLSIDSSYKEGFSDNDRDQELVAQSLSRMFKNEFENGETKTLQGYLNNFVQWFKDLFNSIYNNEIRAEDLSPRMTLDDLSKLINTSDTTFISGFDDKTRFNQTEEKTEFQKAEELTNRIINDSKEAVIKSPNFDKDHTYYRRATNKDKSTGKKITTIDSKEWVPVDTSVTQYIHGKQEIGLWGMPASAIGNTFDTITRDYFSNNLRDSYPNLSSEQFNQLKENLNSLKESLDTIFGEGKYKVVSTEFPLLAPYTDIKGNTKYMAGTMDLFIYDSDGNFHIFDMKTSRSGISEGRKESYDTQVSLYKAILESNYPELRGKIFNSRLIQARTFYPAPDTEEEYRLGNPKLNEDPNQLYYYNMRIQDTKEYRAPSLVFNNIDDTLLKVVDKKLDIEFKSLSDEDKESLKEEGVKFDNDNAEQTPQDKETSRQTSSLYNNPLLSKDEISFIGNNIMCNASYIISHLQSAPEANEYYFGNKFSNLDLTKMSRQDIIQQVGIGSILNYIREHDFNAENRDDLLDSDNDVIFDKLQLLHDNWNSLVEAGYSKLISLEGVTVTQDMPYDISPDGIDESFEESADSGNLDTKEREYWQLGQRFISVKSSLSGDIRRALEKIKVTDAEGVPVKDSYGYNLDTYIDSGKVVNGILEWCRGVTSIEEMESILAANAEANPWIYSIIGKHTNGVNIDGIIESEPLRSKFFKNFRKDFTQYSIVNVTEAKGRKTYNTSIINTNNAAQNLLKQVQTQYKENLLPELFTANKTDVEGKGRVNGDTVASIEASRQEILNNFSKAFNSKFYNKTIERNVPAIAKMLSSIGINVDTSTLTQMLSKDKYALNFQNTKANSLLSSVKFILDKLDSNKELENYNPFEKGSDSSLYNDYNKVVKLLSRYMQDSIEASSYENGKMHYSYVNPSYIGKLVANIKNVLHNNMKFNQFMNREYASYRWFKDGDTWNNEWLRLLNTVPASRNIFDHKVQLSFNKTAYIDLSPLSYQLSLMTEFFSDKNKRTAWYRMPILSNKPSSEFIRFYRYSGKDYKSTLTDLNRKIFNQEILRIRTVLQRAADDRVAKISNFDISDKLASANKDAISKLKMGIPLNSNDLVSNGRLVFTGSGAEFKFLPGFNDEIINKTNLGRLIVDKLNGSDIDEAGLVKEFENSYNSQMNDYVFSEIESYNNLGLFDTNETVKKVNGKPVKSLAYKYIPELGRSYNAIRQDIVNSNPNISEDTVDSLALSEFHNEAYKAIEEYIWNDMFATANIIQLTATDLAYYKGTNDFQKRYSQVYAPALKLNTSAKDSNGNLYSADGISRTIYLADDEIKSDIIDNVREALENKINSTTNPLEKDGLAKMKDIILSSFEKINVADAQGYSSPTSYRKKMGMSGEWNSAMDEAYNRIKSGNYNVSDLGVVWQPLKPFVYSQIRKTSYVGDKAGTMSDLKVPVQNKNSEYMLLLADALTRGNKKANKLTAIFDFMEDSAYDGRTSSDGKLTNEGTYNGQGIDTVQFESAVKSGKMGVIDINDLDNYEDIKNALNNAAYINENKTGDADNNMDRYDERYVHSIPFEDYGIQQEVPAHLSDHEQLYGSQIRILGISDITPGTTFTVNGTQYNDTDLVNSFQKLVSDNIYDSFNKLSRDLKLDGTTAERNIALSKLLREAILKDQRYGADLLRACTLDENNEFTIPLADPIQSIRVQQLCNSIIKSRINKQKIKGGPVVQTSSYGLSSDLNIVWADKNGKPLQSFSEFAAKNKLEGDEAHTKYQQYIKGNQGAVKYFECYLPIPSAELENALQIRDNNGNPTGQVKTIDQAIKEGIIPESYRKAIGYRIPTEDKYSMAPLFIKGFMPKAAGEAVMLPKEITLLSGSDFDIDKLFIILPEYRAIKYDKVAAQRGYTKENDISNNLASLFSNSDLLEDMAASSEDFNNWFGKNKENYRYTNPKFIRVRYDENNPTVEGRNNELFDIQWSVLTNPDTMNKMFNPGSFDEQKKSAAIVNALKANTRYTYDELASMSLKELESINEASSSKNILLPSTQVYLHKQNTTAGKLIGIFANNNTSHGFMSLQDINLLPHNKAFTFNGKLVDNNHNNKLDSLYNTNGGLISKTIAGFLAASVDAVKDPVLNFMNLNVFTANTAMLLARLGYDSDSIGMLLTQPIIERLTDEYTKQSNEGYVSADSVINQLLRTYSTADQIKIFDKDLVNTEFDKNQLTEGLKKGEIGSEFQIRALLLFQRLNNMAQNLNTLTFLTKYNSVTNAVGPTIADTMVMTERGNKFMDKMNSLYPPFNDNAKSIIRNSPILSAFASTTVGKTKGLAKRLFSQYFPHYSEGFQDVLSKLRSTSKSNLTSNTINSLLNDYLLYRLTSGEQPVINGSLRYRDMYINRFPEHFKKVTENITNNALVNALTVVSRDNRCPVPTISAKAGNYGWDVHELLKNAWSTLINDPSTKDIATQLFFYNLMRNGFTYSPKSILHLASVDTKLSIPGYINSLRESNINTDDLNSDDFLLQYRRNHSDNSSIVPKLVVNNNITVDYTRDLTGESIVQITSNNKADLSGIITDSDDSYTSYAPVIKIGDKLYYTDDYVKDNDDNSIGYTEIQPLGNTNNFLEYDANSDSYSMKSVINNRDIESGDKEDTSATKDDSEPVTVNDKSDSTDDLATWVLENIFDEEETAKLKDIADTKGESKAFYDQFLRYVLRYNDVELDDGAKSKMDELKKAINKEISKYC